jgi:replicative DNA helicase
MESNSTPSERFKLTSLPTIRKATNGLERGFCVFGADPNVGKTGILIQIAMDICLNNPDAKVLFYSADDAMLSIVRRMLACHVFLNSDLDLCTPIWLTDSTYDRFDRVIGRYTIDPHRQVKKMMAVEWFFNNEKTKQLKIMCEKAGIEDLDSALEEMGENTILIADAAYKIATPYSEEKQADKHRAEGLKSISIERNTPVICAKDGRKSEKRGSDINKDTGGRKGVAMGQSDIKGDGSWGYEPDLITTMWRNEDESKIQCSVVKNKIMSFAGAFTLQNWPEYNGYKETTEAG